MLRREQEKRVNVKVDIKYIILDIPSTKVPDDDDDDDGQSCHRRTRHRAPPTPTQPQLPFTWFHITRRSFSDYLGTETSFSLMLPFSVYAFSMSVSCAFQEIIYVNVSV